MGGKMAPNNPLLDKSAAVISTGFLTVANPGKIDLSSCCVAGKSGSSGMPSWVAASAVMTQTAPELLMATRRLPLGRQPCKYKGAVSTRSTIDCARIIPCSFRKASTTLSSFARAPVCDWAASWPAAVRPDFKTTIGKFRSLAMRAASARFQGSGIPSR